MGRRAVHCSRERSLLRHVCYWLIERFGDELAIKPAVDRLKDNMTAVYGRTGSIMSKAALVRHQNAAQMYIERGVPEKLANQMSAAFNNTKLTFALLEDMVGIGRDTLGDLSRVNQERRDRVRLLDR